MVHALSAVLLALLVSTPVPGDQSDRRPAGERLMADPAVAAALARVKRDEPRVIEDQVTICEVPAPPFGEAARAARFREALERLGLKGVRIDREGNVIARRPGAAPRPHLVFSAHLDTVFPPETPVATSRAGTVLSGPGITDDCRGLAVILGVVRTLEELRLQTPGSITFVGTVGEEGLGDLRGVRHLFQTELREPVDAFVSVDGAGLGVTNGAVGSIRLRVTFKGPGGHSYGDFGIPNPMHALGRAIARIGDIQVPREPRTTFNVGRSGGGTSVNTIPAEAWMEVDLRSVDPAALRALEAGVGRALDTAAAEENERWGAARGVTVEKKPVGNRPAGRTPPGAPIVQTALSVTAALGAPAPAPGDGSTDANVPISLGVPAITVGGGGTGTGVHTIAETFDTTDSWIGTARAFLLALALAGR